MWRFFDFLFPPRADEAALRDISTEEFAGLLVPQFVPATRPGTAALLSYAEPCVRSTIHEAKYHGSVRAFELLSTAVAEYLRDCDETARKPIIVPVPLGTARMKDRGFNQVAEIIALAACELAIPVETTLLVRTRETVSQVSLPRSERERNMRGAFRATRSADPANTYIVIDDVLTTGATLQAAIDALKEAGAEHIYPLALAH